jgi:hypothetical protein
MTQEQSKWILMQQLISNAKPTYFEIDRPQSSRFRGFCFDLINNIFFDSAITVTILVNMVAMAIQYEDMPEKMEQTLTSINYVFTGVYILEALIKLCAYGRNYFLSNWNNFDLFIAITSLLEFDYFENLLASFSSQGVVIIRVFRLLRISRLFKLFRSKHFARLNMILNIVYISIPSLMNVISLMFLMYIIFSVVAVFMFRDAKLPPDTENEVYNFKTFHSSLLTLFRASTGEDWPLLMYHYGEAEGLYAGSRIFFIIFVLVLTYIMINMIQLIVVQIFEELYFDPQNPLNQFKESVEEFNKVWNIFSAQKKGNAISSSSIISFFTHLQ